MALSPKDAKTTIVLPKEVIEAIKNKTKGPSEFNSWVLFALLKSLKDESFSWDMKQSDLYLDHQLDF